MEKVCLFLMSEKGFSTLKFIIESELHKFVENVFIGEDKNVVNDFSEEIKYLCELNQIEYSYRSKETIVTTNYCIAISWRWLIKVEKEKKIIVLHDSLLPKYRGFAPLVNMLINGEKTIGVTALFATDKYDDGDVIDQMELKITYPIKVSKAIELISSLYCELTKSIISKIASSGILESKPQNNELKSYSLWRDNEDYLIDWNQSSDYLKRFIDAVSFPYLGAATYLENDLFRIQSAEIIADEIIENRTPGKVIFVEDGCPIVVCGVGLLKLIEILDINGKSIIPLKKFRLRFKNFI